MPELTVQQVAQRVGGEVRGPGDRLVREVATLGEAGPQSLSFVRDARHAADWPASRAAAALVSRGIELAPDGRSLILVPDAELALAAVLELFAPPPLRPIPGRDAGVHPAANVDPSATLAAGVAVGAGCYVGPGVRLGQGTALHANVTVLDEAILGADCVLFPGAVVRDRCELGDRVILHPNAVIGADGFGYRPSGDPQRPGLVKIPHLGNVRLGHDVEIGAAACVDRAKFSCTLIGEGTKIDNLVQIGHNCRIGRHCVIAGGAAVAGSVTVEDGVVIGGCAVVKDHVTIHAGARIAGGAFVMGDVPAGEDYGGYPARPLRDALREYAALRKLPELVKLLRK